MITTYFVYYNEPVTFKTIKFKPRQGGVNSINIPKIIKIDRKAIHDFKVLKKCKYELKKIICKDIKM